MNTKRKLVLAGILSAVLVVATAAPVMADTSTASITLTAGSLSVTPQAVAFGSVALTGDDLSALSGSTSAWVAKDPTGSGSGWHITISSSTISDGTHTIPLTGFKVKVQNSNITRGSGAAAGKPTSSITSYTALTGSAQTLVSAATGTDGMGKFNVTPEFTLDVPGDTYAATYSATLTVTIVTAPS